MAQGKKRGWLDEVVERIRRGFDSIFPFTAAVVVAMGMAITAAIVPIPQTSKGNQVS